METVKFTHVAWAHGASAPAASGYSGTSASGCIVARIDEDALCKEPIIHKSRAANRDTWLARIMGIVAAAEQLSHGTAAIVYVNDQVTVNAFAANFVRTTGKPCAGQEAWERLLSLIRAKDLQLKLVLVPKNNPVFAKLCNEVSDAATHRKQELQPEQILASALPPGRKAKG
jgi:hypothetical protein